MGFRGRAFPDEDLRALGDARSWLAARGYDLIRSDRGPMSGAWDEYAGPALSITLWSDRGIWNIQLKPAGAEMDWRHLAAWAGCTGIDLGLWDDLPDPLALGSLDALPGLNVQLAALLANLERFEGACSTAQLDRTIACLADPHAAYPWRSGS